MPPPQPEASIVTSATSAPPSDAGETVAPATTVGAATAAATTTTSDDPVLFPPTADNGTAFAGARGVPFGWRADTYLFFQLFVAIFVAIANGSIFCFSLFSPALSAPPFNFSTRETNIISTTGVILSYFSLPTGQVYDRTSPRVTLAIGATINTVGWLLMYGVFSGTLSQTLLSVTACYGVTQFAATFFETGSVLPNMDAFQLHEGRIVMIQKTFMGLGTSVIASLFNAFFLGIDLRWFFAFLCILSGTAGGMGSWIIRRPQHYRELNVSGLNVGDATGSLARRYDPAFTYAIVILWANMLFVFAVNVAESQKSLSWDSRFAIGLVSIVLVVAFFGMLAPLPSRMIPLSADDLMEIEGSVDGGIAPDHNERQQLLRTAESGDDRIFSSPSYIGPYGGAGATTAPDSRITSGGTVLVTAGAAKTAAPSNKASAGGPRAALAPITVASPRDSPPVASGGPYAAAAAGAVPAVARRSRPVSPGGGALATRGTADRSATVGFYDDDRSVGGVDQPSPLSHNRVHQRMRSDPNTPLTVRSSGMRPSLRDSRMSVVTNPRCVIKNHGALLDNLRRPELWLMWYVSFATWGAMTLVNSNSAQIYKAIAGPLNFEDARNTVFVSLFGLGSALGRVTTGALKPIFEARDIPVWWMFPIAPVLMAVAAASFFVLPAGGLFLPFFAVGYAGGVAWGATVLIIKRLFTEAGRHYSFLYTAGMLTPLFFNLWLFSSTYESHSEAQHQAHSSDCNGIECIAVPIAVALVMNVAGFPLAVLFARRVDQGLICD